MRRVTVGEGERGRKREKEGGELESEVGKETKKKNIE